MITLLLALLVAQSATTLSEVTYIFGPPPTCSAGQIAIDAIERKKIKPGYFYTSPCSSFGTPMGIVTDSGTVHPMEGYTSEQVVAQMLRSFQAQYGQLEDTRKRDVKTALDLAQRCVDRYKAFATDVLKATDKVKAITEKGATKK